MALNAGYFAGLGVWHVPKCITVWACRRVPKRLTGFCGATGAQALSPWGIFRRLGPCVCALGMTGHLSVEFGLVFLVVGERRMRLRREERNILKPAYDFVYPN
jgi:hypothetical protein